MADNEPDRKLAWLPILAGSLLASGIGLTLLSFFWTNVASGHSNWSPEQAEQYQAAAARLHGLSHESVHATRNGDAQAVHEKLEKAKVEYDALRTQLDAAIVRPGQIAFVLRTAGFALLAAGGFGLYYSQTPRAA